MILTVITCDGCGADLTDTSSTQRCEAYIPGRDELHTCSPECMAGALSTSCDLCGVMLAPLSVEKHARWHAEGGPTCGLGGSS